MSHSVPKITSIHLLVTHWANAVGIIQLKRIYRFCILKHWKFFIKPEERKYSLLYSTWTQRTVCVSSFEPGVSHCVYDVQTERLWGAEQRWMQIGTPRNVGSVWNYNFFGICVCFTAVCLFAGDRLVLYAIILGWVLQLRYLLFIRCI